MRRQPRGLRSIASGALAVTSCVTERGKVGEDAVKKESEPHALAFAGLADAVHAVVPVAGAKQGQPVRAGGRATVDGTNAVIEQRAGVAARPWRPVGLVLIGGEQRRFQERHAFIEDPDVATRAHVLRDHVREPEQVVRTTRAEPAPGRLVPPVLDIAFLELMRGRAQHMLTRQVGTRHR